MTAHYSVIERDGYFVSRALISEQSCSRLVKALPTIEGAGFRDLLAKAEFRHPIADIRGSSETRPLLEGLVAVQCTLFHKTASKNWSVKPHRDTVVPVAGDGDWDDTGIKDGMSTSRPPRSVLDQCLAVRIQLDGAPVEDISVVAGSHLDAEPRLWKDATPVPVPRGGALIFRPALVHASSKLCESESRRVLHYLFAPAALPAGYSWYHAI